ncbi:antiviral reverse transcriptase Drt3a [Marinobacter shengliensis]|uniref:antiviral reverse transcriptase Drt3a n=1 Tax=Marinobacter shengliensis TaxID=1389223 RepID=UPI001109806F|nr:antiviral reverse transcriptase Drt3a [Marinobacter shengliensis]
MINIQAFSRRNLVRAASNLRKRKSLDTLNAEALKAANEIQNHQFQFGELGTKRSNSKTTYFFTDPKSKLVEAKVNDNLKRRYNVKPNDRSVTVSQIKTLLSEGGPFFILKLDIKSFFERIDRAKLIQELCSEMLVSTETQWLLKKLDSNFTAQKIIGLPRGLSMSTTLSEIALSEFDGLIRAMPGVYYYSRYVDDILVFCFKNEKKIKKDIESLLKKLRNLDVNEEKSDEYIIQCKCRGQCVCPSGNCKCRLRCKCKETDGDIRELDYLGYKFLFTDTPSGKKPKNVEIDIADKKIKKIKTRIARVFQAYKKSGNYPLTQQRLKFLTGNYPIYRGRSEAGLKGGIYYNYPMLTRYDGLRELDKFKRNIARSMKHPLGRALKLSLSSDQLDWISNISFAYGHKKKVFHKFSGKQMHEIKSCFES